MQSKKKIVKREIEYMVAELGRSNEAPIQAIPGMIAVASVNQHGFTVTTLHTYDRGAAWDRAQRVLRGEVLAKGELCT